MPTVRAKLEEAVGTIPISSQILENQINNMFARLDEVTVKAAQRRIRLKYLEHKVRYFIRIIFNYKNDVFLTIDSISVLFNRLP